MKILFLAQLLPYPPICGGTIRSFNILKHLCRSHDVTLLSYVRHELTHEERDVLEGMCREVRTCLIKRSPARNLRSALTSMITGRSFIVSRDWTEQMKMMVRNLLKEESFDLIYVDHLQMSQFVHGWHDCPKVLDEHNVEWKIIQRIAETEAVRPKGLFARGEWQRLRSYELRTCARFDKVLTVTENDRATLIGESNGVIDAECVPIGVDLDLFQPVTPAPDSKTILSLATMSWPPNIDAARYFYREIYPLIKRDQPDVKLVFAGSKPPSDIAALPGKDPSVMVPGFVEDINALASSAAVFIVPLRSGSGMRVKILNAMAMGLPVVSTSLGCEGIPVTDGENIMIADDPEKFANLTNCLLASANLRFRIGSNGRKFVERNYSWQAVLPRLDSVIDTLGQKVGRRVSA